MTLEAGGMTTRQRRAKQALSQWMRTRCPACTALPSGDDACTRYRYSPEDIAVPLNSIVRLCPEANAAAGSVSTRRPVQQFHCHVGRPGKIEHEACGVPEGIGIVAVHGEFGGMSSGAGACVGAITSMAKLRLSALAETY